MKSKTFYKYLAFLATSFIAASVLAQTGPTGAWDFTISGKRYGVAVLEFTMDSASGGSITGFQIDTLPKPSNSTRSINPRTGAVDPDIDPRTGQDISSVNNSAQTNVNFFGGAEIVGRWFFGPDNRIYGNLGESSQLIDGDTVIGKTNSVSFRASFVPGKRLTLRTESIEGKTVLRGQPSVARDISGSYFGQGRRAGISFVDTFDLTPSGMAINAFDVSGIAADHDFGGLALITSNYRIAIIFTRDDAIGFDSLYGSYNRRRNKASLRGYSSNEERVSYTITQL